LESPREDASGKTKSTTGPSRIRTCNQGIMSPLPDSENPGISHNSPQAPAVHTAVETQFDPIRRKITEALPNLSDAFCEGILTMIDAAPKDG
jgi:hypothetical protein